MRKEYTKSNYREEERKINVMLLLTEKQLKDGSIVLTISRTPIIIQKDHFLILDKASPWNLSFSKQFNLGENFPFVSSPPHS